MLKTLGFPGIWACFFSDLRDYFKTCALFVFGLDSIKICLFFGLLFQISVLRIAFFASFIALLLIPFKAKRNLFVLLRKFAHSVLFLNLPPCSCVQFTCCLFVLLNFLTKRILFCFSLSLPLLV